FSIIYNPKLEYAKYETTTIIENEYIESYTTEGDYDSLYLYTDLHKESILNQIPITLTKNSFVLISYHQKIIQQTIERQYLLFQKTKSYWLDWAYKITSFSSYRDEIVRS